MYVCMYMYMSYSATVSLSNSVLVRFSEGENKVTPSDDER